MERSNLPEMASESESVNLGTVESCSSELTRSNLDASFLTDDNSKHIFRHGLNDKFMTWTNDMHDKYLDYLEASFVEYLQCSMGLVAWCGEQGERDMNISQELIANNVCKASKKFTVSQDIRKQKMNSQKNPPLSNTAASESLHGLKLPQIHYQSSAASSSEEIHFRNLCYPSLNGNTKGHSMIDSAEGTGQNFVAVSCEQCWDTVSSAKRLKTAAVDTSIEDQIVPMGKSYTLEKSVESNSTTGAATNLGRL